MLPTLENDDAAHKHTRITEPLKHMRSTRLLKHPKASPSPPRTRQKADTVTQRTRGGNDLARVPGHGHVNPDFFKTRESDDGSWQWLRMAEVAKGKVPLAVATWARASTRGEVIAKLRMSKKGMRGHRFPGLVMHERELPAGDWCVKNGDYSATLLAPDWHRGEAGLNDTKRII